MKDKDWVLKDEPAGNHVYVYHIHKEFLSRTHQLKKNTYICILCRDVVPNFILFQLGLRNKSIISFNKSNFSLLSNNLNKEEVAAIYINKWNKLYIYDKNKEKAIQSLFEMYNIPVIEIAHYFTASDLPSEVF